MSARGTTGDTNPFNSRGVLTDPTAADVSAVESRVRQVLQNLAVQNLSDVNQPGDAIIRDLLPEVDLASGSDNNWDGNDRQWEQNGMGNTAAETGNETYVIDSDNEANEKIIALFAISNIASQPVTTEVTFEDGTGGVIERQQVEGLLTDDEVLGLFADPIVYGATDDGAINQFATGADDNVVLHGAVAEVEGRVLSESGRFLSDKIASQSR